MKCGDLSQSNKAVANHHFKFKNLRAYPLCSVKIEVYNKQKNLPIPSLAVKKIVRAVIALEKNVCDEVSLHFVTEKKICELHSEYFNDASITDCISFPMDDINVNIGYRILGEVFVCPKTAVHYAQKHKSDPFAECTLYLVHGLLHLMGYDDLQPKDRAAMRRAEKRHLLNLKKLDLML